MKSRSKKVASRISLALLVAGVLGVAGLSQAQAGTRDPRVNNRQQNQHQRIKQGVRSGELTRRETGKLAREQRDVRQLERAYKSDGKLTRAERVDLHQEQNQASRHIYNQKHDDVRREP
jgi:Tfp pilus assembly protein PilV